MSAAVDAKPGDLPMGFSPEGFNQAVDGNSPDHYAKGTPSHNNVLRQLVSVWFQVLLTPLPGCFSSFARATFSLSVAREYLALGDGPPGFKPGFT